MNYHHSYHAGNFGDVFKHTLLAALVHFLQRKENAFCYLDTHAGAGYYDLLVETTQKNKEYEHGILRLMQQKNPPKLIKTYLNCVHKINNKLSQSFIASLRYYPGSPYIVNHFLRPQDRMVLIELHPPVYQQLKSAMAQNKQASVHLLEGYQSLKAFLPPKENRGLILIDPPYERPHEFSDLVTALPKALARFETGTYAIWYPIKTRPSVDRFHHALKEAIQRPLLIAELSIYPETLPTHLNGCGMVIINPPWQFDSALKEILPWLWKALSLHKQGKYQVTML